MRDLGLDVLVTRSTEDYVTVINRLLQDHSLRREMAEAVRDVYQAMRRLEPAKELTWSLTPSIVTFKPMVPPQWVWAGVHGWIKALPLSLVDGGNA